MIQDTRSETDAVGNCWTVAPSTVVSEHAERPPQGNGSETISEKNDEVNSANSEMSMEREMEFKFEIKCLRRDGLELAYRLLTQTSKWIQSFRPLKGFSVNRITGTLTIC
ncbi:uncharacterized protein LOC128238806 isoform X1 [Mya arenaria]|uniref:uncharacterized protein LOC128238806 isoform X1 n=1 Tax=Mya arenaria TaxID=6604 RepID=UPI0022E48867|nr:uncharacterized protein LOC128238806 isoform X1 [Mya arenaria]